MTQMVKLKNISSIIFGVSGQRKFLPNQVMEFTEEEGTKLMTQWSKEIVMNESYISPENASKTQQSLLNKIADLEKELAEAKANIKQIDNQNQENIISDDILALLKEEAKSLGINVSGRPSIETLQAKIAEAKASTQTLNNLN